MVRTLLLIVIIILIIGALPAWPYSGGWFSRPRPPVSKPGGGELRLFGTHPMK